MMIQLLKQSDLVTALTALLVNNTPAADGTLFQREGVVVTDSGCAEIIPRGIFMLPSMSEVNKDLNASVFSLSEVAISRGYVRKEGIAPSPASNMGGM
jgi:hypothetical protein